MINKQIIDEMAIDIKTARKLIKKYERIGIPQLERFVRSADMNLHSILWESGKVVQYRPDLPIED